ncbi:unnamed protein product [Staurois parvus]|uniref:Uncharacterized protein n=1 Tax=Staurois parvus TaxID=386267 RepID=A0ABN9EL83_9NEOB|nr:unnamed protein product [Staurois parvus]
MGPLCPCPNSKKPMKKVPAFSAYIMYSDICFQCRQTVKSCMLQYSGTASRGGLTIDGAPGQ